jgi:hypothetical protein
MSVFEKPFLGSTGYQPVPSGYQPDGMEGTVRANGDGLPVKTRSAVPSGRLPEGAGRLPAPPIFRQALRSDPFYGDSDVVRRRESVNFAAHDT